MTKPADLKPGDQIRIYDKGWAEVIEPPYTGDVGPEASAKFHVTYRPEDDRVMVDVKVDPRIDCWKLAEDTGAKDAQWLSITPFMRYRMFFHPAADVEVKP